MHEALEVSDRTLIAMQASLDEDHPFTLSARSTRQTVCTTWDG